MVLINNSRTGFFFFSPTKEIKGEFIFCENKKKKKKFFIKIFFSPKFWSGEGFKGVWVFLVIFGEKKRKGSVNQKKRNFFRGGFKGTPQEKKLGHPPPPLGGKILKKFFLEGLGAFFKFFIKRKYSETGKKKKKKKLFFKVYCIYPQRGRLKIFFRGKRGGDPHGI